MGMADTSAYQDFTGNPDDVQVHTPQTERLARMGVRFTNAHTPSSRSTTTRYGLLTGRYVWRSRLKYWVLFGVQGDPLIEADRPTIASMLQGAGYHTGMTGKWHLGLRYRQSDGQPAAEWEYADLPQPLHSTPLDHGLTLPGIPPARMALPAGMPRRPGRSRGTVRSRVPVPVTCMDERLFPQLGTANVSLRVVRTRTCSRSLTATTPTMPLSFSPATLPTQRHASDPSSCTTRPTRITDRTHLTRRLTESTWRVPHERIRASRLSLSVYVDFERGSLERFERRRLASRRR